MGPVLVRLPVLALVATSAQATDGGLAPGTYAVTCDTDCQSCGGNACSYSPAVGAFTCGSQICAG